MQSQSTSIPSQVTTARWIHVFSPRRLELMRQINANDSDDDSDNDTEEFSTTVGKWLLYHSSEVQEIDNLSHHDKAWARVKTIVTDSNNTDIISAKCSTSCQENYTGDDSSNGVICCYTEDYRNKKSVKRAGDFIRAALPYPRDMFYKTDNATHADIYRHTGNKAVSMYKHTRDNKMYERNPSNYNKWELVFIR